jgi:hypothetical protein
MKTVMLLGVDGVLNVPREDAVPLEIKGLPFYPTLYALAFMRRAWEVYDVRWLTSWAFLANGIAKWAGLKKRPVYHRMNLAVPPGRDWKVMAVDADPDLDGRAVIWVEDGFTEEAVRWAKMRSAFLVETDPSIGVTPDTLYAITRLA